MTVKKIPLEVLFGDPELSQVQISPDGKQLAFVAPWEGVKNLWLEDLETGERRRLTADRGRGVMGYGWLPSGLLIYLQDTDGDENWRFYAVDPAGGEPKLLTPGEGVQAQLLAVHPDYPDEMLILLNDRDPALHDVWRVNARTGERRRIVENPGYLQLYADDKLQVRAGLRQTDEGGAELHLYQDGEWRPFMSWGLEDSLGTMPLRVRGDTLYMLSSIGRNTSALVAVDLKTGSQEVLAADPGYDLDGSSLLFHPRAERPEAIGVMRDRMGWIVLDDNLQPDFDRLGELEGDVYLTSRDLENRLGDLRTARPRQPPLLALRPPKRRAKTGGRGHPRPGRIHPSPHAAGPLPRP